LPDVLALYRSARTLHGSAFAATAFAWLGRQLRFDAGTLVTSFADRPAYLDAHFHGLADPPALLASWGKVQHLDGLSPLLLARPLVAQRQDIDDPRIAGDVHAPLRAHLQRFALHYSICIAVPVDDDRGMTVLILVRHTIGDRFADEDLAALEAAAPHVTEALAINREMALLHSPQIGLGEMPVAKIDADGHFIQTTSAFARLFWASEVPQTTFIKADCLAAIRHGKPWLLPGGRHCLHALPEAPGWLLRLHPVSRVDRLTARERELAARFAAGDSHKQIAQRTGLAPATVRNHLRNIYAKLEIRHRVELIEALAAGAPSRRD
jgi:DNA-binding CsgD family transcriptional regulator